MTEKEIRNRSYDAVFGTIMRISSRKCFHGSKLINFICFPLIDSLKIHNFFSQNCIIKEIKFIDDKICTFWFQVCNRILDPDSHPYQIIWIWKIKIPRAQFYLQLTLHTAQTKYRNFETNIPRKGISGPQSQFPHSCVFPPSVCLFCWRKYVDCSWAWDYINRSQAHECGNWG